jgi:hypothetical protein
MRVVSVLLVLALVGCGGPYRASDFEQRAAHVERLVLVHTKGKLGAAWEQDLLARLTKSSPVAVKSGGETREPVEKAETLDAQAVVALEVERRSRSTLHMDKLSASHAEEQSYLVASVRILEVPSGYLLWELRIEEQADEASAEVLARCSEQVVATWPFEK